MTGSEVVKQPLTVHAEPLWVTAKLLYYHSSCNKGDS